MASYLDAGVASKQELLEMFDLEARTNKLIELLEASLAVSLMQSDSVALEVERKVREAQPRPRMLLGQMQPQANEEMEKYQKQLDALQLSEDTKTYLQRELNRLKTMPSHHMEHNILRNYMETALSLPWSTSTADNYDLDRARSQLDSDHFGLQSVKRRIIEFLAVRGLKKDMKGFIICFHGPPGVGKTSLGKSIADSLGRKFHRISLGGVRDEAEIRGHRRTYVGALPGVFIHALRKCGSNNPVILLDEIDKVGKDMMRGDPSSALLEVLDPAQNHSFTDHYMAIPFDLSNVLFIATANHIETIAPPLLDRMEMIHITGYSTAEKLQIAKAHLAPRQIGENALTPEQLELQDETILSLINDYTREAGVRQLERVLGGVCRAVAVDLSAHKKKTPDAQFPKRVVKPAELEGILGNSLYENDLEDRVIVPGVALGLAWTPFGGRVLVVETSKSVGTGRLRITGQLGDVMKESVLTALTWIKTHLGAVLPLPSSHAAEGLDGLDIHIHLPAAAVPKDGPSAGVTITTALVSLITDIKVRSDTAMTGEISLKGLVLPVGGVKEKVLAAHRLGIKRIILPAKNQKDLKDLPANVTKEMTFISVTSLHEVLVQSLESPDAITSILKPPILPAKL